MLVESQRAARWGIPGFRTGRLWKQALALVVYIVVGLFLFVALVTATFSMAFFGALILLLFIIAANGWGLRFRIPMVKSSNPFVAAGGWILLFFGSLILMMIATANEPKHSSQTASAEPTQSAAVSVPTIAPTSAPVLPVPTTMPTTPPPTTPPVAALAPAPCKYVRGFADFVKLISPSVAGDCREDEHPSPTTAGNIEQATTNGLLVWNNAKRLAMFTDGQTSWYGCGTEAMHAPSSQPFDCAAALKKAHPDPNLEAITICEKFVADRLKAPSTAKYSGWGDSSTKTSLDGNTVTVFAYVDSQNSFGAMLRTKYVCTVEDQGSTWHLVSLTGL